MKPMKIFVIVAAMLGLLSFPADLVLSAEGFGGSKAKSREWYTTDNLGNWFEDFQWFGFAFDECSFESIATDSSMSSQSEKFLLLLRRSKGQLQPYLSIDPGLFVSAQGVEFDLSSPGISLGLSCSF